MSMKTALTRTFEVHVSTDGDVAELSVTNRRGEPVTDVRVVLGSQAGLEVEGPAEHTIEQLDAHESHHVSAVRRLDTGERKFTVEAECSGTLSDGAVDRETLKVDVDFA